MVYCHRMTFVAHFDWLDTRFLLCYIIALCQSINPALPNDPICQVWYFKDWLLDSIVYSELKHCLKYSYNFYTVRNSLASKVNYTGLKNALPYPTS